MMTRSGDSTPRKRRGGVTVRGLGGAASAVVTVVVVVAGAGAASANALAAMSPDAPMLGSASAAVASCDGTLTTTGWVPAGMVAGQPTVSGVTLHIVDTGSTDCIGNGGTVTFTDHDGVALTHVDVATLTASNALTFPPVQMARVDKLFVTVHA